MAQWILQSEGGGRKKEKEKSGMVNGEKERVKLRNVGGGLVLTGNAAVHHPADHAEQEEQIAHEVAMIPTSCGGETNMSRLILVAPVCRSGEVKLG